MSQVPNPSAVIALLSPARMARYRQREGAWGRVSDEVALERYEEENQRQARTWTFIGGVEVILRNALHEQLTRRYGEWFSNADLCDLLEEHDYGRLEQAWQSCQADQRRRWRALQRRNPAAPEPPIEPGHVVAALPFGFWRKLLSKSYDRELWTPTLHAAFKPGLRTRNQLYLAADRINIQRNRIAHHERIGGLDQIRQDGLLLVGAISEDGRLWVDQLLREHPNEPTSDGPP